jgi:hypothetical protein
MLAHKCVLIFPQEALPLHIVCQKLALHFHLHGWMGLMNAQHNEEKKVTKNGMIKKGNI